MRLRILAVIAVVVASIAPLGSPGSAEEIGVGEDSDAYSETACARWSTDNEDGSWSRTDLCGFIDNYSGVEQPSVVLWHEACDGSGCSYTGNWVDVADGDVVIDYEAGTASVNAVVDGCAVAVDWGSTSDGMSLPLPYDLATRFRDGRVEIDAVLDTYEWRSASADGDVCEVATGASRSGYLEQWSEKTTYLYIDPRTETPVGNVTSRSDWASYEDMGCATYYEQVSEESRRYTSACGYESSNEYYDFGWLDIYDSTCRYSDTGTWCEGTYSWNHVDGSTLHFDMDTGVGSIDAVVFDCAVDLSFTATGAMESYQYPAYVVPDADSDGVGITYVAEEYRYRDAAATGSICHLASGESDHAEIGAYGESSEGLWLEPGTDLSLI